MGVREDVQKAVDHDNLLHGDYTVGHATFRRKRVKELEDALMQIPAIALAEFANDPEHPERRLAVIEDGPKPDFSQVSGDGIIGPLHAMGISQGQEITWNAGHRKVVKKEER